MRVVYSSEHRSHAPTREVADGRAIGIYEVPGRAETIKASLEADGGFELIGPVEHGSAPITAVHDPAMLAYLEDAWRDWRIQGEDADEIFADTFALPAYREGMGPGREPRTPRARIGRWCFDTATPVVEGTYPAARAAVDVALTASELVLGGEGFAYGLCRPPGHHAARALFGGYCFFNNAAIVAEDLVRRTGGRVAILDVDYHHGNGTQQIFYAREDVLYVSLHGDPDRAYPYFSGFAEETGAGAGVGATLNLPLPEGCSNEVVSGRPRARARGDRRVRRRGRGRVAGDRHLRSRSDLRPRADDGGVPRRRQRRRATRARRRRPPGGRVLPATPRRERPSVAARPRRPGGGPLPALVSAGRRYSRYPTIARSPTGKVSSPKELATVAWTPCRSSSAGTSWVSTSTLS